MYLFLEIAEARRNRPFKVHLFIFPYANTWPNVYRKGKMFFKLEYIRTQTHFNRTLIFNGRQPVECELCGGVMYAARISRTHVIKQNRNLKVTILSSLKC